MFLAGSRIGPYQIVGRLGAGGMGEVYRARDPRLDRSVAVKVLTSTRGSTPEELERFEREARAIARVSHPNICTVYDVGQEAGVPFLVMELLEGETLAERVLRGPVPIDAALAIATQIAEALDELHSEGVVHRDLKPSNVMLTAGGVKLLDFGLAKLRDGEYEDKVEKATKSLHLTGQGTVLGTLPYMAPEQVEGRPADARTDTFALGVVLYEMITGLRACRRQGVHPPRGSRSPSAPTAAEPAGSSALVCCWTVRPSDVNPSPRVNRLAALGLCAVARRSSPRCLQCDDVGFDKQPHATPRACRDRQHATSDAVADTSPR